jgi:hypothetical protein
MPGTRSAFLQLGFREFRDWVSGEDLMLTETVLTMVFVGDFAAIATLFPLTWPSSVFSKCAGLDALRDAEHHPILPTYQRAA